MGCDPQRFLLVSRPVKCALLQPLIQQDKTVVIPVQSFDPVAAATAEQKQSVIEGVQLKLLLDNASQAIYAAPQVGIPCCQIDLPWSKIL